MCTYPYLRFKFGVNCKSAINNEDSITYNLTRKDWKVKIIVLHIWQCVELQRLFQLGQLLQVIQVHLFHRL